MCPAFNTAARLPHLASTISRNVCAFGHLRFTCSGGTAAGMREATPSALSFYRLSALSLVWLWCSTLGFSGGLQLVHDLNGKDAEEDHLDAGPGSIPDRGMHAFDHAHDVRTRVVPPVAPWRGPRRSPVHGSGSGWLRLNSDIVPALCLHPGTVSPGLRYVSRLILPMQPHQ